MRGAFRCPRCGELRVGSFNSLCLSCYTRIEGFTAIVKPRPAGVVQGG